jgi:type I restriction enzyme S subunit
LKSTTDKLPRNWVWTNLGNILSIISGEAFKKKDYSSSGVRLLQIANVSFSKVIWEQQNFLSEDFISKYPELVLRKNDIVMALNRPLINGLLKIACLREEDAPAILYQRVARFNLFRDEMREYFLHYAHSPSFIQLIRDNLQGSDQPYINTSNLPNLPIPIPPLNEQRRIVAKIEALKAWSQRVKEELEAIPALLDQFRQSVLAAAFRGDLTADWREKNPDVEPASVLLEHTQKAKDNFLEKHQELSTVQHDDLPELPDSWTWAVTENLSKFESNAICAGPFGTIFKAKDFRESGIPIIFLRHVGEGKYLTEKPGFMDIDKWEELFKPYSVWGGELLITKLGEPPGSCAIYPEDIGPAMVTPDVIKMSVNTEVALKHYLMYYFNSATSKKIAFGVAYGVTRLRMNLSIFRKLPIPLAPLLEQQEITRQVQILYRIADQVEQQYKEAKSHLDQLNQSILAKAFRGELVPQDPNDEPASVLLERIRAEREKLDTKKKAKDKTEKKSRKAKPEPAEPKQLSLPGFE